MPDFLSAEEERDLLERLEATTFHEVRMHGVAAKRTTRHYGWTYGYESFRVEPTDPVQEFLLPLRARVAPAAGVEAEDLAEALLSRYPEGAGIGWHRDAPAFGEPVIGVSLGAPCTMKFRRETSGERVVWSLRLEPRSLYALSGEARRAWQHHIPAAEGLRYSITFRTLSRRTVRALDGGTLGRLDE